MSIKDYFDQHGEAAFRAAEAQLLAEIDRYEDGRLNWRRCSRPALKITDY